MSISVIIPSRERFYHLGEAIGSLLKNAHSPEQIEILIKVDNDDPQLSLYKTLPYKVVTSDRGAGYIDMHRYFNELCKASTGDWILLFNDDARMVTKDWDLRLTNKAKEVPSICILQIVTSDALNLFPIVSRAFYEALGHFSMSPHGDTYLEVIAQAIGRQFSVDIHVIHLRDEMNDTTYASSQAACFLTSPAFYSDEVQTCISQDIKTLSTAMQKEGTTL